MASSFIKPSERQSYYHPIYGKGEVCYHKGHSTLVKFENHHKDLIRNPLQGARGIHTKYLWVNNVTNPGKQVKSSPSMVVKSDKKDDKRDSRITSVENAITLLKKEGFKVFKMVEV